MSINTASNNDIPQASSAQLGAAVTAALGAVELDGGRVGPIVSMRMLGSPI